MSSLLPYLQVDFARAPMETWASKPYLSLWFYYVNEIDILSQTLALMSIHFGSQIPFFMEKGTTRCRPLLTSLR